MIELPQKTFEDEQCEGLRSSIEGARTLGFDFAAALRAQYGDDLDEGETAAKIKEIESTASEIAHDLGLAPEFFEKPDRTILLLAVAERWNANEQRASEAGANHSQITAERDMLVDICLHIAGRNSSELIDAGIIEADIYYKYFGGYPTDDQEKIAELRADFFEKIVNHDLSKRLNDLLHDKFEGSVLERQRLLFGTNKQTEEPFEVIVLDIEGDAGVDHELDFERDCVQSDIYHNHGFDEQYIQEVRKEIDEKFISRIGEQGFVSATNRRLNRKFYDANLRDYFGELPGAWACRMEDGSKRIYVYVEHAMELMYHIGSYQAEREPGATKLTHDTYARLIGTIFHEYGHTQKSILTGGLTGYGPEERKAELSGDEMGGYLDVKCLFEDLKRARGVDAKTILLECMKLPDNGSAGAFYGRFASAFGLYNALLLAAMTPREYVLYGGSAWQKRRVSTNSQLTTDHMPVIHKEPVQSSIYGESLPYDGVYDRMIENILAAHGDEILQQSMEEWREYILRPDAPFDEYADPILRRKFGMNIVARYMENRLMSEADIIAEYEEPTAGLIDVFVLKEVS